MQRHIQRGGKLTCVFLAVLLLTALAPAHAAGDGGRPERFAPIPNASGSSFTPEALQREGKVEVILELSGAPVGKRLSDTVHKSGARRQQRGKALVADIERRQQPTKAAVAGADGEVLHSYAWAYNGLAVRVTRGKVDDLAGLPNVRDVHPVHAVELANGPGVALIGGDTAWEKTGHTGEGVQIGVIDTGIDYTHANFGGPGTTSAFTDNDGTTVEPGTFPTAKVAGGHDFVGDEYDASSSDPEVSTPNPDPDPLDCQGHGSHVAGTAAGIGVLAGGETYGGVYDTGMYDENDFEIAPGVAPDAKLYAYRVFGCSGSASEAVIVAAMDRALRDGVDVVNMSLGSPFGRPDEPTAMAANTLSEAGVSVVTSSGNSGRNAYITGAPAIADRAISVAAMDASSPTYPGAELALSTGESITIQNSNGAGFRDGATLDVKVLRAQDGSVGLGCRPEDYQDVEGKLVVTKRGTCARVVRAIYGQQAGAAAVAMINDAPGFPPFEGEINENPTTGEKVDVTIPFLGVRGVLGPGGADDGNLLAEAGGETATLTPASVPNPGYTKMAAFSSAGPRSVDSRLKPDVTAPGVSIQSTAIGTGTQGRRLSGTSMSAPMVAGSAALVAGANASWTPAQIKSALMSTAGSGTDVLDTYDVRRAGAGVVRAPKAVTTDVLATTSGGRGSLSFEYEPLSGSYSETKTITLSNVGDRPVTYDLAAAFTGRGQGADIEVSPESVTVAAGEQRDVQVTLSLSDAAVANLPSVSTSAVGPGRVLHVEGAVTAAPREPGEGVYELRVPFLAVPRGLSDVQVGDKQGYEVGTGGTVRTTVPVTNHGVHAGAADVYAWGITDSDESYSTMDVRSVGVQSLPGSVLGGSQDDRSVVFAVNTHGRWSNASISEFDVLVDNDGDPSPEYAVIGADVGLVLAGSPSGVMGSFAVDTEGAGQGTVVAARYAEAPMNGSTVLLPALASEIGLSGDSTRFTYTANAFSLIPEGHSDTTHSAVFDPHAPSLSTGDYAELAPGDKVEQRLSLRIGRFARAPAFGWLIVSVDDENGAAQADRVPVVPDAGWQGRLRQLPQPQAGEAGEPGIIPEPGQPVK